MAQHQQHLPCDGDGVCMLCKAKPSDAEILTCKTCVTPWHVECLASKPKSYAALSHWECPDCSPPSPEKPGDDDDDEDDDDEGAPAGFGGAAIIVDGPAGELIAKIRAIEADSSLSEPEKAKKRQELLSGNGSSSSKEDGKVKDDNEILEILGENIKCSFCMQLPDRPVTTPCGHNFCLKCFEKWVGQGKRTCAKCRVSIPAIVASQPRINASLVFAIRMARTSKPAAAAVPRVIHFVHNEDLPDKAFTTDRAKKSGKANAKSGKIFVTIPNDHLGPIPPEHDPVKNTGVLVGDTWEDRLACRQWGAHFPHVSGIAGQQSFGSQSVVLSGGYDDDEDHGEWFLYTGSGGRDLSGNKRTNKVQSKDQKFTMGNEALRLSCRKGYPVRVVRSHKEKRSNYAPETGVRYDGIYRIEKCWMKMKTVEVDEKPKDVKVCRYLFVRCDNSPAPWTSDEHGDRPRPLPKVSELKKAMQLTERQESPHWDFDEEEGCWKWKKPPPSSKKGKKTGSARKKRAASKVKIMKEFSCMICRKVLHLPITTPCAHNFCKACLDGAFQGQKFVRERNTGGRSLRTQKNVMKCPCCPADISEFLPNAQVNRELEGVVESLMRKFDEEKKVDGEASSANESEVSLSEGAAISTSESGDAEVTKAKPAEADVEMGDPVVENEVKDEVMSDISDAVKAEPTTAAKKRGRPKKNTEEAESKQAKKEADLDIGKPVVDKENQDATGAVKAEPVVAKKRGRPKKNAAASNGAAVTPTKTRKSRRVANEGNVSPSSPLHVRSDNELE